MGSTLILKKISIPEPHQNYMSSKDAALILKNLNISLNNFFSNTRIKKHHFQNYISYCHANFQNIEASPPDYYLKMHKSFMTFISEYYIEELKLFINSFSSATNNQGNYMKNSNQDNIFHELSDIYYNGNRPIEVEDELMYLSEKNTETIYSFKLNESNSKRTNILNMYEKLEEANFLHLFTKKNFISLFRDGKTNCIIQWYDEDVSNLYNFIGHLSKLNKTNPVLFFNFPKHIWNFSSKIFKTKKGDFISPDKRNLKPTIKDHILKSAVDFLK